MKYPCEMIQDLLPLYLDGVCSEESKKAVSQHLKECTGCNKLYTAMCDGDKENIDTYNIDLERQKAASFQAVKKRMFRKQIFTAVISVVILIVIAFAVSGVLKNTVEIAEDKNVSVSMVNGALVGRLKSSRESDITIKRITLPVNGQQKTYLFFCVANTKWDKLTTGDEVFSEYILCPDDKNADEIDAVYYFVGEYDNIETMGEAELLKIIDNSALLWQK
ncbi:MAG: zf-HC2 domain-containing protein [Acutalibacteraceae bacterium]